MKTIAVVLLVLCSLPQSALPQSKGELLKPEIMVAPAYPNLARARGVEATVAVRVFVDLHGTVTRVMTVEGPCRYSSPSPQPDAPACDYATDAEAHLANAKKLFSESLDDSLPKDKQRAKYKEYDTETWLAAQDQVYAAAEQAAKQWLFESRDPATPPGHQVLDLTFRFKRGPKASIQVIDPWSITVVTATYPSPSE